MTEPTPKDARGPTNLRIKFRSGSLEQFIERYAIDVSRGGIFIRTREPLAVGTKLRLELQLQDATQLLAGEGTVVWIREPDQTRENVTPGMGVRFDKLTPESQPALEKILAEKTRLEQAGVAAANQSKGGGMAVRRPSGVFANLDATTRAALGTSSSRPAAEAGGEPAPSAGPAAASSGKTSFLASRAGAPATPAATPPMGPFSRARATATRPVPIPSALFEPPTETDIDKALEVLHEASGPAPALRQPPTAPRYVADDLSNEPTRVADVVDELVGGGSGHTGLPEPAPGLAGPDQAPLDGTAGTEPPGTPAPVPVESTEAISDGSIVALDEAVVPADDAPEPMAAAPVAEPPSGPVEGTIAPEMSRRFRAASRAYPTLQRRRGLPSVLVIVVLLAAGAGVIYKMGLFRRAAGPAKVAEAPAAAPAPATPPPPLPAAEAAGGAPSLAGAAAPTAPAEPKPAPSPAATAPAEPKPAPSAAAEKPAGETEDHPAKRHRKRAADEESAAAAPAAAEKTAAEKPAAEKPAADEKPAAEQPADDKSSAAAIAAAAVLATPPVLKVTSTPAGALVLIDGKEAGTTPLVSRDVDPAAPHTITIKKDGYDANERMVSGLDWSRGHGTNPQTLKVNAKLHRTAAAAPAAAPAAKDNAEQPAEDTGGPYIKEVKPDAP